MVLSLFDYGTYWCIILQERLGFDNQIAALEKAIKTRRKDLNDLESMYTDSQLARDMAKVHSRPVV